MFHALSFNGYHFGKSQENLKKTFLAGLLNYNRKGYPQQTFFKDGLILHSFESLFKCITVSKNKIYRILPNTRASPNRRAPQKCLDQVGLPAVSSSKIYMTT